MPNSTKHALPFHFLLLQLSALRLFHQLLSDASLRGKQEHRNVLQLATRVVRGLFAKLAPQPAPAAAQPAVAAAAQTGDAATAAAAGGGGEGTEAGAAAVSDAQKKEQEDREQRRQAAVAGMVCLELMFWPHNNQICQYISDEYRLRPEDQ